VKTPRYTDQRYPHGYRKSTNTDIKATFRRVRDQQKKNAEEAHDKVRELKKGRG
jgi:hypothetical protein